MAESSNGEPLPASCATCHGTGIVPVTGRGSDGYDRCPGCGQVRDLMAALEQSLADAKQAARRHERDDRG